MDIHYLARREARDVEFEITLERGMKNPAPTPAMMHTDS